MRALGGWRGALWRTGFGLAAFCLFFPSQWETFVFSFEVIFVLSALFATISFIALLLYWMKSQQEPAASQGPWIFLLLSILAALGATFSLANGNLVWPLLVAAALLLRLRLSAILVLIISGTAGILTYFHHYISPPGSVSLGTTLQAPARTLEYLATYLGASWTTTYNRSAMFYGIAGLVLLLSLIPRFRLPVETSRVFSVELLLILMFCLGNRRHHRIGPDKLRPRPSVFLSISDLCLVILVGSAHASSAAVVSRKSSAIHHGHRAGLPAGDHGRRNPPGRRRGSQSQDARF